MEVLHSVLIDLNVLNKYIRMIVIFIIAITFYHFITVKQIGILDNY